MFTFMAVHLWQSTLTLLAAWGLTFVFRRSAAAIRYWIWFAASLRFLVPLALLQEFSDRIGRSLPDLTSAHPVLIETTSALFVPPIPNGAAVPDTLLLKIQIAVAAVWALGTVFLCLRWFLQWRALRATVAHAPQVSMDLPAPIRITSSELTPGVFGVFKPVVIMPRTVMRELGTRQLQAVLAHEACHIRRRDNLTAAIHKCVEAIFWFHPLVWWIGANLLREREAACDESVIEEGHEQRVYAESILSVCRMGVVAKLSGVAASTGGDLAQRMRSIMSREQPRPIGDGRFALLCVAATLAFSAPIAAGIVGGAIHETGHARPIMFAAIALQPSEPDWPPTAEFDADAGKLVARNVSLRSLIAAAYPWAEVTGDREIIDFVRYDIDARWNNRDVTTQRNVYRELLRHVLQNNSNIRLYVSNPAGDTPAS